MKHVIIGAGASGIAAIQTIREFSQTDEIVLISSDEYIHSRCMLHLYIDKERNESQLSFVPESFIEDNSVEWIKGKEVTGIDTQEKIVKLQGQEISFDKLLIATGANSFIPPVGELTISKNVFGLRHLADAQQIKEKAKNATKVAIIGAGLVGLDAAYALLKENKQVQVVEMQPTILSMNLDEKAAATYQTLFENNGCEFYLGKKVVGSKGNNQKEITHLVLGSGEELACDLVVVAVGVKAATEFLQNSAIEVDRAIKVNEFLQTNCEDIYAAGDVTGLSAIWPNAVQQGQVAAKNMCGLKEAYTDQFAVKNTLNFYGLPTLSVGQINPNEGDTVLVRESKDCYNKVILHNDLVVGVILQGNINYSGYWQYLIKNKISVATFNKPVWNISFADFCKMTQKGDYVWGD